MKILVIGGLGFLGIRCLEQLNHWEATVVGRQPLKNPLASRNHTYVQLDISHIKNARKFIKQNKYSHLLYLAWPPSPPHDDIAHIKFAYDTINFVSAFGEHNPNSRIILIGSIHEVGNDTGLIPDVIKLTDPSNLYGLSKKYVYNCLNEIFRKSFPDLSFCWVRLSNIYGVQDHPSKLISQLISKTLFHTSFELISGNKIVDFVHVKDAAQGVISALNSSIQGAINIGSGNGVLLSNLQKMIQEWAAGSFIECEDSILTEENLSLGAVLNITKAREVLFYKPMVLFSQGVQEYICIEKEKRHDIY